MSICRDSAGTARIVPFGVFEEVGRSREGVVCNLFIAFKETGESVLGGALTVSSEPLALPVLLLSAFVNLAFFLAPKENPGTG